MDVADVVVAVVAVVVDAVVIVLGTPTKAIIITAMLMETKTRTGIIINTEADEYCQQLCLE